MPTDTERMDWLCEQAVDVRVPLRWGSRALFTSVADLEEDRSDLRQKIDAAMANESNGEHNGN